MAKSGKSDSKKCVKKKSKEKTKSAHRTGVHSASKASNGSVKSKSSSGSKKSVGLRPKSRSSISSMASTYHQTTGRYAREATNSEAPILTQSMGLFLTQYGSLYDCVQIFLVCPTHKKVALSSVDGKELFLPFGPIKTGESWRFALENLIRRVLVLKHQSLSKKSLNFNQLFPSDVLRIQIPVYYDYITRVTYYVELEPEAKCCQENDYMSWYELAKLSKTSIKSGNFAGPEPVLLEEIGRAHV